MPSKIKPLRRAIKVKQNQIVKSVIKNTFYMQEKYKSLCHELVDLETVCVTKLEELRDSEAKCRSMANELVAMRAAVPNMHENMVEDLILVLVSVCLGICISWVYVQFYL
jgi:DNA repair ATPase RecN